MAPSRESLMRWHAHGRAAWPGVDLPFETFAQALAAANEAEVAFPTDLYLATACIAGNVVAIRAFEAAYFSEVGRRMARLPVDGIQRADVEQMLRLQLFVAPAKLVQYKARGPLRMWVRVTVSRMLQNIATRGHEETLLSDSLLVDLEHASADPELKQIKDRFRAELHEAFASAVVKLEVRDRLLLQQAIAGNTPRATLARAYDVHINTIDRWIRRARARLEAEVRTALAERLRSCDVRFDSMLALVRSRLDVTLGPPRHR